MTLRIALALILLVAPLLAVPLLRTLPIEFAMGIWGVAFCGAVVILLSELKAYVRRRGYYVNSDRPTSGIAGRPWGLIIPNLLLPPVIIFIEVLGIVGLVLGSTPAMYWAITIAGLVVMSLYLRTRMRKSRVREAIEIREDGAEYSSFALKAPHDTQAAQSIDALEAIAQAIGVSPEKLRLSDRFGYEIGTLDALDDTLDLVGALLLNRRKVTRNTLSLSDVKTVGDFLIAWRHSHVA